MSINSFNLFRTQFNSAKKLQYLSFMLTKVRMNNFPPLLLFSGINFNFHYIKNEEKFVIIIF